MFDVHCKYCGEPWDNDLFQDSYRLRNTDIYDLGFYENTSFFNNVLDRAQIVMDENPLAASNTKLINLVNGSVPGQEILIRRMINDVIENENYYKYINPVNVIFFGKTTDNQGKAVVDKQNFGEKGKQLWKNLFFCEKMMKK